MIVRDPRGLTPVKATEIPILCLVAIRESRIGAKCAHLVIPNAPLRICRALVRETFGVRLVIVRDPCGLTPVKATEIPTLCFVAIRESRIATNALILSFRMLL